MVAFWILYLNTLIPRCIDHITKQDFFLLKNFLLLFFCYVLFKSDSANLETLFVVATIATPNRQQIRHKSSELNCCCILSTLLSFLL